jgi:hypothetical protein
MVVCGSLIVNKCIQMETSAPKCIRMKKGIQMIKFQQAPEGHNMVVRDSFFAEKKGNLEEIP